MYKLIRLLDNIIFTIRYH